MNRRLVCAGGLVAGLSLALACFHLYAAESLLTMRLRANDTDSREIWQANFKAIAEHPGCCDEIWFSTGCGVPPLEWHRARAAVIAEAVKDLRAKGIVPSLQFQATLGHGDQMGTSEMFASKAWTGWTGWQGLETRFCNCPRQPAFHAYLREVSKIYAPLGFAALWIDDDLRIAHHQPSDSYGRHIGCWCETCLKAFNAQTGASWSRAALAKAVETDDALFARWRAFSIDAICQVARTIAVEFHTLAPETRMAFQQAHREDNVDQVSRVLKLLHEVSGLPVGFRPGGGDYYDDDPNGVVAKSLQNCWFRQRVGNPDYATVWTPEIESWPRTYYSRSSQGVLVEGWTALMYGMNAISFFISDSAKENPSLYGRTFWKTLSAASPVLHDYAQTIQGCTPVGFTMEGATRVGIRRAAIPVLSGIGRSVGLLTGEEASCNLNMMTSAEVQKLRDALDARAGGLPAVVKSPFAGLMQMHVDGAGALRCVAFLNMRIADQGPVRVFLRNVAAWKGAVWHEMCRPPVPLTLEPAEGGAYVVIPNIGAWNGGFIRRAEDASSHNMPTGGICAHRGDRAAFPENTVPAFLSAVSNGAAMVEFDVQRCKTGELIVMHDGTIDRTTTGHGKWAELTFDYLRSVDAGVKRGASFAGTKIPTFDEAIDCFPTNGVWLNVHCGDDVTDEVARKIKAKGRLHQAFIAAHAEGVARARAAVPEIKVCLFSLPADSWNHAWTPNERRASIAAVRAAKAEFTQPHSAAFEPEELHAYHAEGGKVNYFWCNKPSKLGQLLARGIDFPLTDNLKPMVEAYRQLRGVSCVPNDPEFGFNYLPNCERITGGLAPIRCGYRREDRKMGGIPSVAVSPKNGRLWRTYYGGPSNGEDSNNYVILSTRAPDGAWEDVLVYDPDGDGPIRAFDPEVWIAPDGKLHWTWTNRKVQLRTDERNRFVHTWSAQGEQLRGVELDAENPPRAPYPTPRTLVKAGGVMMCKPIVSRDGSWLYPVAFWNDDFSARIYRSTDGGKTLQPVGGVTLPARHREFEEHNIVELKDGTLRVYMRVKGNGAWNAWQADSRDGGRTWDAAKPCPFPHTNSRFFVRRLASGALLLVKNGSLTPPADGRDYGNRTDLTAFVSDDDGATWTGGLLLHKGGCAYPDGDQAPDGTIHVTFDGDRYTRQEIFHVSFTEADVRRAN